MNLQETIAFLKNALKQSLEIIESDIKNYQAATSIKEERLEKAYCIFNRKATDMFIDLASADENTFFEQGRFNLFLRYKNHILCTYSIYNFSDRVEIKIDSEVVLRYYGKEELTEEFCDDMIKGVLNAVAKSCGLNLKKYKERYMV